MEQLSAENTSGKTTSMPHLNDNGRLLTASSIIGDKVVNSNDETIGNIKDIMINTSNGCIEYAVLEFGGLLGFGEKLFSIPFGALKLDFNNQRFVLNVSKEVLEKAPGFNKEHWPNTNSHQFDMVYWGPFMGVNSGVDF